MKTLALIACTTGLGLMAIAAAVTADSDGNKRSIEGAWEMELVARFPTPDCTSGDPLPFGANPFPALYTYHKGGTMSEYGSRQPPSVRSAGHGVWEKSGSDQFASHVRFFEFDENGLLARKLDLNGALELTGSGDTLTGVTHLTITDISGNVFNFCLTMDGNRIPLVGP